MLLQVAYLHRGLQTNLHITFDGTVLGTSKRFNEVAFISSAYQKKQFRCVRDDSIES